MPEDQVDLIFQSVMGEAFEQLVPIHRDLHTVRTKRRWRGQASVHRGSGILSRLIGWMAGFPGASESVSVEVHMERNGHEETWTRTFGSSTFRSYLSAKGGKQDRRLCERFGVLAFEIDLSLDNGELYFPVGRGTFFGVPLPKALLPISDAKEYVDPEGRVCFHVSVAVPLAGSIATYKGWLRPADNDPA